MWHSCHKSVIHLLQSKCQSNVGQHFQKQYNQEETSDKTKLLLHKIAGLYSSKSEGQKKKKKPKETEALSPIKGDPRDMKTECNG